VRRDDDGEDLCPVDMRCVGIQVVLDTDDSGSQSPPVHTCIDRAEAKLPETVASGESLE